MKRGYLYIAVTTLLFSSMEVALKLISGQFNPIQLNFSRFIVGGLVLIPFAVRELKKRGRKLDGKALGSFALLGLMGIAVSMSLYQLSVTRVQASVVGVLFSSNPVFVTLFAFLLLHETISKNQIAGSCWTWRASCSSSSRGTCGSMRSVWCTSCWRRCCSRSTACAASASARASAASS